MPMPPLPASGMPPWNWNPRHSNPVALITDSSRQQSRRTPDSSRHRNRRPVPRWFWRWHLSRPGSKSGDRIRGWNVSWQPSVAEVLISRQLHQQYWLAILAGQPVPVYPKTECISCPKVATEVTLPRPGRKQPRRSGRSHPSANHLQGGRSPSWVAS